MSQVREAAWGPLRAMLRPVLLAGVAAVWWAVLTSGSAHADAGSERTSAVIGALTGTSATSEASNLSSTAPGTAPGARVVVSPPTSTQLLTAVAGDRPGRMPTSGATQLADPARVKLSAPVRVKLSAPVRDSSGRASAKPSPHVVPQKTFVPRIGSAAGSVVSRTTADVGRVARPVARPVAGRTTAHAAGFAGSGSAPLVHSAVPLVRTVDRLTRRVPALVNQLTDAADQAVWRVLQSHGRSLPLDPSPLVRPVLTFVGGTAPTIALDVPGGAALARPEGQRGPSGRAALVVPVPRPASSGGSQAGASVVGTVSPATDGLLGAPMWPQLVSGPASPRATANGTDAPLGPAAPSAPRRAAGPSDSEGTSSRSSGHDILGRREAGFGASGALTRRSGQESGSAMPSSPTFNPGFFPD